MSQDLEPNLKTLTPGTPKPRSTTTTPTGGPISKLGSSEVCAILEASAKAHVTKLKFGDLEVEFGSASPPAQNIESLHEIFDPAPVPVTAITEEHKKMIAESLRRDEVLLKDEQLAYAVVEDPVLAEELIQAEMENGELSADVSSKRRT